MMYLCYKIGLHDEEPALATICQAICESVREDRVYITRAEVSGYKLSFEDNTSSFEVSRIVDMGNGTYSFSIKLLVLQSHGTNRESEVGIWCEDFTEVGIEHFYSILNNYYLTGFPNGNSRSFSFNSTYVDSQELREKYYAEAMEYEIYDDNDEFVPAPGRFISEYSEPYEASLEKASKVVEPEFAEAVAKHNASMFAFGNSENEQSETDSGVATTAIEPQTPVVPDFIGRIRVVALKYKGEVIAFRFKTDVGAFDMRKAVAAKFGLGGFKTEKFIELDSVNGLLMSSSERKQQVCVPDVSDCEEDCRRLMQALFNA